MIVRERAAVKITRIFDFPREAVFKMWIDPKNVAKWWGAEGDVTAACEVDPRPGGAFNVDVRLPNGTILPMTGSFTKIVAPELLVFRTAAPNSGIGSDRLLLLGSSWEAVNTVTFEELGPKRTRVTVAVVVISAGPEELEPLEQGFKGGWAQSLKKLQIALN